MSFQLNRGLFQYDFTDRHAILGIGIDTTVAEVGDRYKYIAKLLHPDSSHWQTAADKQMSVQLFSKLVTHAYGKLSRNASRDEDRIVIELIGKRLVNEGYECGNENPQALELYQAGTDFDRLYQEMVKDLASKQFQQLDLAIENINHLSELNRIYIVRKQLQTVRSMPPTSPAATNAGSANSQSMAKSGTSGSLEKTGGSTIDGSLRRAEEYLNMKDWNRAIKELRDATNIDSKSSTAHALLGLAYLRQKQMTMAKVSIDKALKLNPKDPKAIQAKQELDKATATNSNTTAAAGNGKKPANNGGFLGGLFGKK
jgi:tetratricopeptide (TPR) repeat protein